MNSLSSLVRKVIRFNIMRTIAVIDLGSNSSKLLVASVNQLNEIRKVFEKTISCRLASEITKNGQFRLDADKISQLLEIVRELHAAALKLNPAKVIVVGTEALRKVSNQGVIQESIRSNSGLELIILSGTQEASGIAAGIATDPFFREVEDFHAFDLGGGSMELIEFNSGNLKVAKSLPLGAVRLTEQFFPDPAKPIRGESLHLIAQHVHKELTTKFSETSSKCKILGATGGALVFCRKLLIGPEIEGDGKKMPLEFFQSLLPEISELSLSDRLKKYPEIPGDRLDIMPAALTTIIELMKFLHINELIHSLHNLRFGIAANFQNF